MHKRKTKYFQIMMDQGVIFLSLVIEIHVYRKEHKQQTGLLNITIYSLS